MTTNVSHSTMPSANVRPATSLTILTISLSGSIMNGLVHNYLCCEFGGNLLSSFYLEQHTDIHFEEKHFLSPGGSKTDIVTKTLYNLQYIIVISYSP